MIEESLKEVLFANTGILAMLGGVQDRYWPLAIPQHAQGDPDKLPCIVFRRVSDERGRTFCETDDLVNATFQFDFYSKNYTQSRELAKLAIDSFKDYTGLVSGVRIHTIFVGPSFDLQDPDPGLYRVSSTFNVWYKE